MTNTNTTTEHAILTADAAIAAMDAMIAGDDAVAHTGDDAIAAIDEVVGDDGEPAPCDACGQEPEHRTCDCCGATAWVIDCGHHAQPCFISPDESGQRMVCERCEHEADDGDDDEVEADDLEATVDADDANGYWEICDADGQSYGVYQGDTEAEALADLHVYQAWTVELAMEDVTITKSDYASWVADQA